MNCHATLAREHAERRLSLVQAALADVNRALGLPTEEPGICACCGFKPGPEEIARANAYLSRLGVPADVLEVRS